MSGYQCMNREDFLPTSPTDTSIQCHGSWPHTPEYFSDPYQPLSPSLCATVALGARVRDGMDLTAITRKESIRDGSLNSTHHEARITVSGAGLWNNIEDNEDHSQREADGRPPPPESLCMACEPSLMTLDFRVMQEDWPQQSEDYFSRTFVGHQAAIPYPDQPTTNSPHDIFGPNIKLDAVLPLCDSSYATAGAFNEDILYPNLVLSAAQESRYHDEPGVRSRVNKIPRTQARQQGAKLNNSEATKEMSLMDDVNQFYIEADETEDVAVNAQCRHRVPHNPICKDSLLVRLEYRATPLGADEENSCL